MPRVQLNTALTRVSGEIDGYVFKMYRGRTLLTRKPTFTKPWSVAQGDWRKTFSAASGFAALVKADPELREQYRRRGKQLKLNYRQVALRDYFHAPEIHGFNADKYQSAKGGTLAVAVRDDFAVVGVQVTLRDAAGAEIMSGEARLAGIHWHFEVPPPAPGATPPATAEIAGRDRPGNVTTRAFPLP